MLVCSFCSSCSTSSVLSSSDDWSFELSSGGGRGGACSNGNSSGTSGREDVSSSIVVGGSPTSCVGAALEDSHKLSLSLIHTFTMFLSILS